MGYWCQIPGPTGFTVSVLGVGSAGAVWGISTDNGVIFQYLNGEWTRQPGSGFYSVIASQAVWGLSGPVYYWSGTEWQGIGTPGAAALVQLAAGPWPSTYALDADGALWQISVSGNDWVWLPGPGGPPAPPNSDTPIQLTSIAVGANQQIFGLGYVPTPAGGQWQTLAYNGTSWQWIGPALTTQPQALAAWDTNNVVLVVNNTLLRLNTGLNQWVEISDPVLNGSTPSFTTVAIGVDGTMWAANAATGDLYYYVPNAPVAMVSTPTTFTGPGFVENYWLFTNLTPLTEASEISLTFTGVDLPSGVTASYDSAGLSLPWGFTEIGAATFDLPDNTESGTFSMVPTAAATVTLESVVLPSVTLNTNSSGGYAGGVLTITVGPALTPTESSNAIAAMAGQPSGVGYPIWPVGTDENLAYIAINTSVSQGMTITAGVDLRQAYLMGYDLSTMNQYVSDATMPSNVSTAAWQLVQEQLQLETSLLSTLAAYASATQINTTQLVGAETPLMESIVTAIGSSTTSAAANTVLNVLGVMAAVASAITATADGGSGIYIVLALLAFVNGSNAPLTGTMQEIQTQFTTMSNALESAADNLYVNIAADWGNVRASSAFVPKTQSSFSSSDMSVAETAFQIATWQAVLPSIMCVETLIDGTLPPPCGVSGSDETSTGLMLLGPNGPNGINSAICNALNTLGELTNALEQTNGWTGFQTWRCVNTREGIHCQQT